MSDGRRARVTQVLALLVALVVLVLVPGQGGSAAPAAPRYKVLGLYQGTWDAAHISFVKEANPWFSRMATQHNFSYTASTDWNILTNDSAFNQYQVVMFLDALPGSAAQRSGFQRYVERGGGWLGFHVAAYNDNPNGWGWYHNTLLGTGRFRNNTWGPTTAKLKVENRSHPATAGLPSTFTSSVSEWYSWTNDLRQNPNIQILASVDPSSFPLGTDPNQTWRSGYYPIMWTNKNYRVLYANFGHNAMDYPNNRPLSSTFASETQNKFLIDGLNWLGSR